MQRYGIDVWGQESFVIEDGCVKVNHGNKPSLVEIVREIRENGHKGPLLLRFPHLIEKQIELIYEKFNSKATVDIFFIFLFFWHPGIIFPYTFNLKYEITFPSFSQIFS